MFGAPEFGSHPKFLTKPDFEIHFPKRKGAFSEVDVDDKEKLKRQNLVLIRKLMFKQLQPLALKLPGEESHRSGKIQGEIWDVKALTG